MNKGDSELMARSLLDHGFIPAAEESDADIVVFNPCSVRAHAENRALARMRAARKAASSRGAIVVAAGCMAQRMGGSLVKRGYADLVLGTYRSPAAGPIVLEHMDNREHREFLSMDPRDLESRIDAGNRRTAKESPWHEWLSISHGCDNRCAYCIVPSVRGPLHSFPSKSIIDCARSLADRGVREITLLGQNVNQYGMDSGDIPFARLLEAVARVDGIERVGFLTSHPKDFSSDIVEVIAGHGNISRSIHLPLQSGSDRILEAMNRKYTLAQYRRIVEMIAGLLPRYSLSTDLIVGFPGETREDFACTMEAVKEIRFDEAFMYAYSPRPDTPAYAMEESLTGEEKLSRLRTLIDAQRVISRERLLESLGSTEEIIVESRSRRSAGEVMGKTLLNHPAVIPGGLDDIGKKIRIAVKGVRGSTLYGERIA